MYPASYSPNRSTANSKVKRETPAENPWPLLSAAEHRVALQLMHGLSNKEIARAIGRSDATVKNQMRSMFCRAGYSNRGTLTVALLKNIESSGLVAQQRTEAAAEVPEKQSAMQPSEVIVPPIVEVVGDTVAMPSGLELPKENGDAAGGDACPPELNGESQLGERCLPDERNQIVAGGEACLASELPRLEAGVPVSTEDESGRDACPPV